jgi:hypothetical protein
MSDRPKILHVGGTLYWVIRTRDPDTMVLKDADSTPTVAVRKNGASTADSVTVTKRSATTGIYDCSYNPASEVEGDSFTIEESATVTGTTTTQATYTNSWELRVVATTAEIADAVWDEPYSQHTTAGTFGKLMDILRKSNMVVDGVVSNAITPTTTQFSSDVDYPTGAFTHAVLLWVNGSSIAEQNSPILSYVNTNGVITVEEAFTEAPEVGDEFVIIPSTHVHSIAAIQSGLATTTQLTTVEGKVDAIDGVTDKLDTTLELDGSVYRFTTNALEQAPSGGGGGGSSIMVTPVVSQTPVRVIGQNISTFLGDLSTITVGVFSGSDPVDLSGFGDLEVCVQERSGVDLDFVAMADLTISGDDNNYVSWDPAGPSVADVVRGKWSLRKTSNKQVIAYGAWIVEDAALEDTGS